MLSTHTHKALYGRHTLILALLLGVVLLAGCSTFSGGAQQPQPQTVEQRLAALDLDVAAAIQSAADARRVGLLTDAQIEEIDGLISSVNDHLDAAWAVLDAGEDLSTAQERMAAANRLMLELYRMLPDEEAEQ